MESTVTPNHEASTHTIVQDVLCTLCGCLCDDLTLSLEADQSVAVNVNCPRAREGFAGIIDDEAPVPTIHGRPVSLEEAAQHAARQLRRSRYPVIDGLWNTSVEAQRLAVHLAETLGGVLIGGRPAEMRAQRAAAAVGMIGATLGEVRHRADVILVWNSDPVATHPRHFERYSLDAFGRFLPNGRQDRTLIVAGSRESSTDERANHVLRFAPSRDAESLAVLQAILRGIELDPRIVEAATGIGLDAWAELAGTLRRARYGVILHDAGAIPVGEVEHQTRALLSLVELLNESTCFAYSPLGGSGNQAGAEQVVGWMTARCGTIDFTSGVAQSRPDIESITDLLRRRAVDAAVLIHSDPLEETDPTSWQWLGHIPTVVLSETNSVTSSAATVTFRTAALGRDSGGHIFRSDGVCLPAKSWFPSQRPSDEEVLTAILDHLSKVEE